MDWVFAKVFGLGVRLDASTADLYFDTITDALTTPDFRPRALFERFDIEIIATTESPLDTLEHHAAIRGSGWNGRVITAYRPDPVIDSEFDGFHENLRRFSEMTGRIASVGLAIWPHTGSVAPSLRRWARRAPTTATQPRARPIYR